jgi:uncharacterized membrane protein
VAPFFHAGMLNSFFSMGILKTSIMDTNRLFISIFVVIAILGSLTAVDGQVKCINRLYNFNCFFIIGQLLYLKDIVLAPLFFDTGLALCGTTMSHNIWLGSDL